MPRTTKRPNQRLLQGARSREEILDAAARMMSARGFDATSVADIARESGLPNSSIYWHFNSKAGILAAVMERGAARFFVAVEPVDAEADETPGAYLHRALHQASKALEEHPEFLRLFIILLLGNDNDEVRKIVERVRADGRGSLHRLIARAYRIHGSAAAEAVADATVDFALAVFDGAFLAMQSTTSAIHGRLMDQLAEGIATLAAATLERVDG